MQKIDTLSLLLTRSARRENGSFFPLLLIFQLPHYLHSTQTVIAA
jgi:hypothetical protein